LGILILKDAMMRKLMITDVREAYPGKGVNSS
jgi:hypothetical protein